MSRQWEGIRLESIPLTGLLRMGKAQAREGGATALGVLPRPLRIGERPLSAIRDKGDRPWSGLVSGISGWDAGLGGRRGAGRKSLAASDEPDSLPKTTGWTFP